MIGQGWPLRRGAVRTGADRRRRADDRVADGGADRGDGARLCGYAARYGAAALEDLLAGAGIDMLDRASAATGLGGFATAGWIPR